MNPACVTKTEVSYVENEQNVHILAVWHGLYINIVGEPRCLCFCWHIYSRGQTTQKPTVPLRVKPCRCMWQHLKVSFITFWHSHLLRSTASVLVGYHAVPRPGERYNVVSRGAEVDQKIPGVLGQDPETHIAADGWRLGQILGSRASVRVWIRVKR